MVCMPQRGDGWIPQGNGINPLRNSLVFDCNRGASSEPERKLNVIPWVDFGVLNGGSRAASEGLPQRHLVAQDELCRALRVETGL